MKSPLVSVCIPTRNGAEFIEETLQCVIQQDYRPLELIVSDDDSSDETIQIISAVTKNRDIPVKIFHHTPSVIGANWNHCVRNASGKYIKFVFQDDLIYPGCISEMVALAETDEKIGLVFCDRDIIGESEDMTGWLKRYGNLSENWNELKPVQDGKSLLRQPDFLKTPRNKIGEPTVVLLNRECFDKVGFFSEDLKQTLDYEYWYRLMPEFKIGFIGKKLAAFRLHANQATQQNRVGLKDEYRIYYQSVFKNAFRYLTLQNIVKISVKVVILNLKYRFSE